jgi:hypothetical protein
MHLTNQRDASFTMACWFTPFLNAAAAAAAAVDDDDDDDASTGAGYLIQWDQQSTDTAFQSMLFTP